MIRRLLRLVKVVGGLVGATVAGGLAVRRRAAATGPDSNRIRFAAVFEQTELRATAPALTGGWVFALAGNGSLDLRRTGLASTGGTLRATIVGGTVEITVPDTWLVSVSGPPGPVSADVTDPRTLPVEAPPLHIDARVLAGRLEVVARPVLKPADRPA